MEGGYELCSRRENVYIHVGNKRAKGSEIKEQCNGKLVCLTTYGVLTQDSIYKVGEKETKDTLLFTTGTA